MTPTNSVLSFFDTGSLKGIIGNLWVLLQLTCSLNPSGRGSSPFVGRHRWVSFFCWFSLLREVFTGYLDSPLSPKPTFQIPIRYGKCSQLGGALRGRLCISTWNFQVSPSLAFFLSLWFQVVRLTGQIGMLSLHESRTVQFIT